MRELDPKLNNRSDAEVAFIRDQFYELADIAFDIHNALNDSKVSVGLADVDDTK